MMYVVPVFRKWESLQVLGLPLSGHQEPGCIGFLPVFETYEQAEAWCIENEHPTDGITAIRSRSDVEVRS